MTFPLNLKLSHPTSTVDNIRVLCWQCSAQDRLGYRNFTDYASWLVLMGPNLQTAAPRSPLQTGCQCREAGKHFDFSSESLQRMQSWNWLYPTGWQPVRDFSQNSINNTQPPLDQSLEQETASICGSRRLVSLVKKPKSDASLCKSQKAMPPGEKSQKSTQACAKAKKRCQPGDTKVEERIPKCGRGDTKVWMQTMQAWWKSKKSDASLCKSQKAMPPGDTAKKRCRQREKAKKRSRD